MSAEGGSAAARAAAIRAEARKGLWRRIQAWLGIGTAIRRADAKAAKWERGAQGEKATARLLAPLGGRGWYLRHDLGMPNSWANMDHVLVAPSGAVIVLETKAWGRSRPTQLVGGRVHWGTEDRHAQMEAVGRYAAKVAALLGLPADQVRPLVVVHGSPVNGGSLTVEVPAWPGPLYILSADSLVPTLGNAGQRTTADPARARAVAARIDCLFLPYMDCGHN
ncbi:nuclease-related domain-containing protein [Streptomyces violascens]|uniref:nuclease-related domain-containing protein n=1 Tax=Streptomyces violascens TaxID=67381 RepID=UPI0037B29D96